MYKFLSTCAAARVAEVSSWLLNVHESDVLNQIRIDIVSNQGLTGCCYRSKKNKLFQQDTLFEKNTNSIQTVLMLRQLKDIGSVQIFSSPSCGSCLIFQDQYRQWRLWYQEAMKAPRFHPSQIVSAKDSKVKIKCILKCFGSLLSRHAVYRLHVYS